MTAQYPIGQNARQEQSFWQYGNHAGIRYAQSGSGGTSLILLHEMGGQIESWDRFATILANDFRMLAYDQRGPTIYDVNGTAGNQITANIRNVDNMLDHMLDMADIVEQVGLRDPQWLIAAAAGAGIAMAYAAHYPHLVAGIVMCAPAVEVDIQRRAYLEERAAIALRDGMQAVVDTSLSRSYPSVVRRDPAAFAAYRARMLRYPVESYASSNRLLANIDLSDITPNVRCPCLVLAGTHDVMRPPSELRRLAASLADAEFAEVDSAHLMAVQTPDELAALVSGFISRHPPRASWHSAFPRQEADYSK